MFVMKKRKESGAAICLGLFVLLILTFHFAFTDYMNDSTSFKGLYYWKHKLSHVLPRLRFKSPKTIITCDRLHERYDLCSINGPTLLDPTTSTLFPLEPTNSTPPFSLIKIRPYPRKTDGGAMYKVKEITLSSTPSQTPCTVTHTTPALLFSAGGYTGNFFHDFNDGFIPLFITVNSLFSSHDLTLVITDCHDDWAHKYSNLLLGLSNRPIINLNKENSAHCFPSVITGLVTHGIMTVDPTKLPHRINFTLVNFATFLKQSYNVNSKINSTDHDTKVRQTRPKLVLVSRKGINVGRVILNEEQVMRTAEDVGFNVTIFQPSTRTSLEDAFRLFQRSHVMFGVHGAAMTHSLFLRRGSVLVQVVPVGAEWVSEAYFERPAREMGLEYVEYKIRGEESSLMEKYGANGLVLKDPKKFHKGDWAKLRKVYLKEQNVKLDLVRLRKCLEKVYYKAKRFMETRVLD